MSAPTSIAFGVGTFNIQNLTDLSRANTRKCAAMIGHQAAITGCQETIEPGDNADLDAECPPSKFYHLGRDGENDLMVKKSRFTLVPNAELPGKVSDNSITLHLHGGLAHVSPSRTATRSIFYFRANKDLTPFAVINFHLVSGVYKGNDHLSWRRKSQKKAIAELQQHAEKLVANGIPVFWMADTNWHSSYSGAMPKLAKGQRMLVNDGIDKIGFIPAKGMNWDLHMVSAERHPNPSDHDFRVANVEVRANKLYGKTEEKPATVSTVIDQWLEGVPTGEADQLTDTARTSLRSLVKGR